MTIVQLNAEHGVRQAILDGTFYFNVICFYQTPDRVQKPCDVRPIGAVERCPASSFVYGDSQRQENNHRKHAIT